MVIAGGAVGHRGDDLGDVCFNGAGDGDRRRDDADAVRVRDIFVLQRSRRW